MEVANLSLEAFQVRRIDVKGVKDSQKFCSSVTLMYSPVSSFLVEVVREFELTSPEYNTGI